jgi:alpha-methylacyl-CoA racemase
MRAGERASHAMEDSMAPLTGLRIVTLALNVPGPVAAARLRTFGARVTKVEPPAGDPLAIFAPAWYAALHDETIVHHLDLKTGSGQTALRVLLAEADLLLTASRPAALARLGLAWPTLQERFPLLAQVAIVGHPAPAQDAPGHDLTYLAPTGLLAPPALPRTLAADLLGAERAASTALALLLARQRGESPAYAEVALADAAETLALPLEHGLTTPDGLLGGGFGGYNLYQTRDGWVALAALEPHFWARFCQELGLTAPADAPLRALLRERTTTDWIAWAVARDLPLAAVQ